MEFGRQKMWPCGGAGEVPEVDEEGDVAGDVAVARKGVRDDDAHRVVVDGHSDHRVQESLERPVEGTRGFVRRNATARSGRFFFHLQSISINLFCVRFIILRLIL